MYMGHTVAVTWQQCYVTEVKVKVKFTLRTGHEDPKGE